MTDDGNVDAGTCPGSESDRREISLPSPEQTISVFLLIRRFERHEGTLFLTQKVGARSGACTMMTSRGVRLNSVTVSPTEALVPECVLVCVLGLRLTLVFARLIGL